MPEPAKPRPLATIPGNISISEVIARLSTLQEEHPNAVVLRGRANRWELWPENERCSPAAHDAGVGEDMCMGGPDIPLNPAQMGRLACVRDGCPDGLYPAGLTGSRRAPYITEASSQCRATDQPGRLRSPERVPHTSTRRCAWPPRRRRKPAPPTMQEQPNAGPYGRRLCLPKPRSRSSHRRPSRYIQWIK